MPEFILIVLISPFLIIAGNYCIRKYKEKVYYNRKLTVLLNTINYVAPSQSQLYKDIIKDVIEYQLWKRLLMSDTLDFSCGPMFRFLDRHPYLKQYYKQYDRLIG